MPTTHLSDTLNAYDYVCSLLGYPNIPDQIRDQLVILRELLEQELMSKGFNPKTAELRRYTSLVYDPTTN